MKLIWKSARLENPKPRESCHHTNVIVSGILSPEGTPAQILRLVLSERVKVCHDPRILLEYERVLLRPKFAFPKTMVFEIMGFLKEFGEGVTATPLHLALPDPFDAPFLEVAITGQVDYLITGNLKHFPKNIAKSVAVVSPAEFIRSF